MAIIYQINQSTSKLFNEVCIYAAIVTVTRSPSPTPSASFSPNGDMISIIFFACTLTSWAGATMAPEIPSTFIGKTNPEQKVKSGGTSSIPSCACMASIMVRFS